jgi:rod shape-determining protein MreC
MSKGKKRFIILISLSLIALTIMTYQRDRKPFSFLKSLSYPYDLFNKVTANITTNFKGILSAFETNKILKKKLEETLLDRQAYDELIHENKRLKELLALKSQRPDYVTTAKVVGRGYDRLLNTLVLDKGRSSGIQKDMAVITANGLVGKIYSVKNNFSEVLLLKDQNFSVAVRLQKSRWEGVLSGTGRKYCLLKYIPPEETVENGEVVITSGLDGNYPPGVPVGVVTNVKKEGVEFFQFIEILPFQSDTKIEEVVILNLAQSQ